MMRAVLSAILAACFLAACATDGAPNAGDGPAPGERGGMCGGIAGFACAEEGDYCAMEPGECAEIADAAGVCRPLPKVCTREYRPVCGCDGRIYPSACSAAAAGVSVAPHGMCE